MGRIAGSGGAYLDENAVRDSICRSGFSNVVQFRKVDTDFLIDETHYSAKSTVFYLPDSAVYFSVVSNGFEIVRAYVCNDSALVINRVEKIVYRRKIMDSENFNGLISFKDLLSLLDNSILCDINWIIRPVDHLFELDMSRDFLKKIYYFDRSVGNLVKAEIFDTRLNEYLLMEKESDGKILVYVNYLGLEGSVGFYPVQPVYESSVEINMSYSEKYEVLDW
ncbi:MAG: hypothetical protein ACOYXB_00955 [Bacteroidota bacterium]